MKRKYAALRTVAVIITVIAWIVLIVGVIGSIAGGALAIGTTSGTYAVVIIIGGIVASILYFLVLLAFAQLIYLFVDVERNTRETAYRLRGGQETSGLAEE